PMLVGLRLLRNANDHGSFHVADRRGPQAAGGERASAVTDPELTRQNSGPTVLAPGACAAATRAPFRFVVMQLPNAPRASLQVTSRLPRRRPGRGTTSSVAARSER